MTAGLSFVLTTKDAILVAWSSLVESSFVSDKFTDFRLCGVVLSIQPLNGEIYNVELSIHSEQAFDTVTNKPS